MYTGCDMAAVIIRLYTTYICLAHFELIGEQSRKSTAIYESYTHTLCIPKSRFDKTNVLLVN